MATFRALDVEKIANGISGLSLQPDLIFLPVTDSTNRVARDLPAGSWRHGTVVLTDFQQAGRGRKGRGWIAPAGSSLLMSIVLVPPPAIAPAEIVMVAALAVADAVELVAGVRARLKWPNDVLLEGRKVCGILAEYTEDAGQRRVVLGIGLNVNLDPTPEAFAGAASLSAVVGRPVDRERCAIALFNCLDVWYRALTENGDSVFAAWADRLETVGKRVQVAETDTTWEGTAIGVVRNGGLQVRTADGNTRVVYAADVSLRAH